MRRNGAVCLTDVLLLNIGVERIEENADVRVMDLIAERYRVSRRC